MPGPNTQPSLPRRLLRWVTGTQDEARDSYPLSFNDYASLFSFQNNIYPLLNQSIQQGREEAPNNFGGYVESIYKRNGVVFACMLARLLLFSEARFQFQRITAGRPGDLFGTAALSPLEKPWPGAATGDLLSRAIQDVDLAGNFYVNRRGNVLRRMRPDWVSIMLGSQMGAKETAAAAQAGQLDAEVVAYLYFPGGKASGADPVVLDVDEVAHFAPIPDPTASYRGMSWLTPVISEIMGDRAASQHKLAFFENGATPNLLVMMDPAIKREAFQAWVKAFEDKHQGAGNAYKTLFLGAAADAKVIGADMRQIDFKQVQGAGETRIAAAAGVPPVIVGLSEGLQAATYSNYAQARRRFADGTIRPLWRNFAASMSQVIEVPGGSRLWYDDRDIPFLREDRKDAAEIEQLKAATIRQLIEAGFEPDSAVKAVESEDMGLLKHTGLVSVQLQPPGAPTPTPAAPASNGSAPAPDAAGRSVEDILAPFLAATH